MNALELRATASLAAAFAPSMRGHTVFPMRAGVVAAWLAIAFGMKPPPVRIRTIWKSFNIQTG